MTDQSTALRWRTLFGYSSLVGVRGTWGRMRSSGLLAERCTTAAPSLPAMLTGPSAVEPHSDPPLGSLTNQ